MTTNKVQQTETPLLPCPFCGSAAEIGEIDEHGGCDYQVACSSPSCGTTHCPDPRKDLAIENWNRRELAELREKVEWIAVGDRLPDEYDCVLIWRAGIPVAVGPIIAFWTGKKWAADVTRDNFVVTHWQPLPEPPSSKSEVSVSSQPGYESHEQKSVSHPRPRQ